LPERVDFRSDEAQQLVTALEAELFGLYERPDQERPRLDAFDDGVFVVVRDENDPARPAVACGGLRERSPGVGEVKRMYTEPAARGQGHGRAILEAVVDYARSRGLARLILETGDRQTGALALYAGAGWTRCACFAPYDDEPDSVCFELEL
jgi:GNAT superfamily N-acetyltransferase